jgi:hypothetical protein
MTGDSDMFEFYAEKNANEMGEHIVHRETCPSLPAKESLHYIGVRSNTTAPLNEAANWYSKSAPCPVCIAS